MTLDQIKEELDDIESRYAGNLTATDRLLILIVYLLMRRA